MYRQSSRIVTLIKSNVVTRVPVERLLYVIVVGDHVDRLRVIVSFLDPQSTEQVEVGHDARHRHVVSLVYLETSPSPARSLSGGDDGGQTHGDDDQPPRH